MSLLFGGRGEWNIEVLSYTLPEITNYKQIYFTNIDNLLQNYYYYYQQLCIHSYRQIILYCCIIYKQKMSLQKLRSQKRVFPLCFDYSTNASNYETVYYSYYCVRMLNLITRLSLLISHGDNLSVMRLHTQALACLSLTPPVINIACH